jgi:hypothetical protein
MKSGTGLKVRLLSATCVALAGLVIAPVAAGACSSLGNVHGFTGHAFVSFDGSASGPIEGSGGSESIALHRSGASLRLKLNHKVRGRGEFAGITIFSGKVRMGNVSVDDTFSLSEGNGDSGKEAYQGPALGQLGTASVFLDTDDCLYAVTVGFGAHTKYSGEGTLRPGGGISVAAFGDRNKIPENLHLVGGVGPDAYLTCPGNPILTGKPCITFGGGWATDFSELKECGAFPGEGNCATGDKPVGGGKFLWVLKPG